MIKALAVFGFGLGISALRGFVVQDLWGWFVAPLGIAELSYWQAWGMSAFVGFLVVDWSLERGDDPVTPMVGSTLYTLVVWGLCALASLGVSA